MPKFIVKTHSTTVRTYEVEANNKSAAISKIMDAIEDGTTYLLDHVDVHVDVDEPFGEEVQP